MPLTINPPGTAPVVKKRLGVVCEDASGNPTSSGSAFLTFAGSEPFKVEMKLSTATTYTVMSTNAGTSFSATGLQAGQVYNFRVTDACGTSVVTDVTIEPLGQLSVQNTAQPCVGSNYTLSGPDEPGATYQWTKDGTVISTARELSFTPYNKQNDGTYVLNVTFGSNCVKRTITTNLNSSQCNNPLPVRLRNFTVAATPCGTLLKWETSSEKNFREFLVERSADAREFTGVGRVLSAGSADGSRYSFAQSGLEGTYYYRLKMIDTDNTFALSRMVLSLIHI